jgi:2-C-methyl-D-erythritol 2,4-cyclodiphosphate synthase|tara:strand:- start:12 stop:485 length:474 start_codon:yes stop_codon:yes gene_type:complete
MIKTGIGYDIHKLASGNKLIVGGVEIKSDFGSIGHSDGDVLIHAIVDSLLGASSLGDIGQFFPSDDSKWKDIYSLYFLEVVEKKLQLSGYRINHIDSVVILEKPQLSNYITKMRTNISNTLKIDISQISVKATTADYLDSVGKNEAIAAQAITTLEN